MGLNGIIPSGTNSTVINKNTNQRAIQYTYGSNN